MPTLSSLAATRDAVGDDEVGLMATRVFSVPHYENNRHVEIYMHSENTD